MIKDKLQNYSKVEWPEKVYIQTDKSHYATNDSIWFTAYLVNGITHLKSTKSAVLYAELINDQDSIVSKRKLYINDVSVQGDFKIGKDWKKGKYVIRAYTNYMRNADSDYFFEKVIDIWSQNTKETLDSIKIIEAFEASIILEKPDLNFYPEGGYLIENVTCKVAIKIKNESYSKIPLSGHITDNDGTIISEFSTLDYGLGVFNITPQPNKTYYANLDLNGSEYKYQLPEALAFGYGLNINNKDNHLLVEVKSTTEQGLAGSYLMLHQRGEILFDKLETETKTNYFLRLATDALQDGVAHLTLFNYEGKPVCERLVFIENPNNKATIKIEKDKNLLGAKEKISLKLTTEDAKGSNLPSYLSMSVRDINAIPHNNRSKNIKMWLLLNSDLRGDIGDPSYFFSVNADYKSRYLLDLVMMTNGWRRFTWQNLLYGKNDINTFPIEKGITISGTTKLLKPPNSATPAFTTLTFYGDQIVERPVKKSNAVGKFSFGPFVFYDSIQTIIQSRLTDITSEKAREVLIFLDEAAPSPKVARNNHINNENQNSDILKVSEYGSAINFQYNQSSQKLDEVLIIGNKKSERKAEMEDISKFDDPSYRLDIESDESLSKQTVISLLARLPGVSFMGGRPRRISIRGSGSNPLIFLDDVAVTLDYLAEINANQISFIDLYKGANAAIYSNSKDGVIVIYTRRGSSTSSRRAKRKPGVINYSAQGFYTAMEFYSPKYSSETNQNTKTDIRTTLHWEPKIRITRQNQTQEISFFTCDIKGDYIIEIEGISDSGIPLYQTSTFSVE
ncbi:TonB-dependent receptor plug domain-containing protein [uncultured Winogradskyella sp.]|uniref:TonB-dependent receptor plug domain-containing protein n=1 Tax=uncultured Winogradskyella sp. TaxID=395353 RepID=UPI0030D7D49C